MAVTPSKVILPTIVISQFAGTSLWFAGNAVANDIERYFGETGLTGILTSSVQGGFILGTLLFAFFAISDKYSPKALFLVCSLLGAGINASSVLIQDVNFLIASRFLTGLFLAGIYPIGMKIAAGWYKDGLGKALGFLVGALVLGTAFPHLVRGLGADLPWQQVIITVSAVAAIGGMLVFALIPDGPYITKGTGFNPKAFKLMFSNKAFTASAWGYFGHMWELYAFWAFLPAFIAGYFQSDTITSTISINTFLLMSFGFFGCVLGGVNSLKKGSKSVAFAALSISGICCLLSPLVVFMSAKVFYLFMALWCYTVIMDSPQFSSMVAKNAPEGLVGSSLTIVNSIGFAITILSITLLENLAGKIDYHLLMLPLALGPIVGLLKLRKIIL